MFESIDNIESLASNNIQQDIQVPTIITDSDHCHNTFIKSSLLLAGNPLICSCENHWWSTLNSSPTPSLFLINKTYCLTIVDQEALSCRSISLLKEAARPSKSRLKWPLSNKFQPIRADLIAPALICPYEYQCSRETCACCDFTECDCAFHCPRQCTCARDFSGTFDIVNCTNVQLTSVPSYLPISTTNLQLRENRLKRIQPYEFFGRFNLAKLDLSYNQLGFIEEKSFQGLERLDTLKLSHNQLQILLGGEFKDLTSLEVLLLDNNRIQFISNVTFSCLIKLKYLNVRGNYLRHMLDHRKYFQFNTKLINLNVDKADGELAFGDTIVQKAEQGNLNLVSAKIASGSDTYFE